MELSRLKNSGQNTLEICLATIIGIILLLGAMSTWSWFNKTMAERMGAYKATRHVAISTAMGKKVNYTPEKLDIFGMASGIGPSLSGEIPDLADTPSLQHCYDTYEEMLNQSHTLRNESIMIREEAGALVERVNDLKNRIGKFTVEEGERWKLSFWLFFFNAKKFSESSFEEIKRQFLWRSQSNPSLIFYDEFLVQVSSITIVKHINKGIPLEAAAIEKTREAQEKERQYEDLAKQAPIFLVECLEGNVTSDQCLDDCWQDYGELAQQQARDTELACVGLDLEQCQPLYELANQTNALYQNCTAACPNSSY